MKKLLLAIVFSFIGFSIPLAGVALAEGEKVVFAYQHEYDNLDPHLIHDYARVCIKLNMYDNLLRWVDNPPKSILWLAQAYDVSDDGLKVTFKLRKGIKFHDGSEVTAEAVKYSIERLLALGKGSSPLFRAMIEKGSTQVIDKYTVEFNLTKKSSTFLSIIPELFIVNPKICKAHEVDGDWGSKWLVSNEAGSGSYQLIKYDPAVGFTMQRFQDHFMGWKHKYVDVVEFRTIRELASRIMALQKGEIHSLLGSHITSEWIDKLEKAPDIEVLHEPSMKIFVIDINNKRPPLNDVHVRRAISYAFDYDGYISKVMGGKVTRNPGPIPNNMWGAPQGFKGYEFDLDKAKKELALAREKVDRTLKIHSLAGVQVSRAAALILQNGLSQLGIKLDIVEETWPVLAGKATKVETTPDLWLHFVSTYYPDPDNWIGGMYRSVNHGTWKASSWYTNEKVDDLLNRGLEVFDTNERRKLYEEAYRLIVEDAPSIFIYNLDLYGPIRKELRGIRYCPIGQGHDVRWIYLEK